MKTESEIREAEEILGFVARTASARGDNESYAVAASIAMALKWVLNESVGPSIDMMIHFGVLEIIAERERAKRNN